MRRYIEEMLDGYLARPLIPWHMPGHKRKAFFGGMWDGMFSRDVTEVPGTDDYHHPEGAILESERAAAKVYGTAYSHYLVGGSTSGIIAAVLALTELFHKEYGKEVQPVFLTAKNVHRSVRNALRLADAGYIDLIPDGDPDYGPILTGELERGLESQPEQTAVRHTFHPEQLKDKGESRRPWLFAGCILTSPTYGGAISPLKEIHDILAEEGIPLLVDEAHGAHLPFAKDLSAWSGISCGAEIVVQSLHKTLPALTQTAIVHLPQQGAGKSIYAEHTVGGLKITTGSWYALEHLEKCLKDKLAVVQSSSPSYLLMASAEQAVAWADENREAFDAYLNGMRGIRAELRSSLRQYQLVRFKPMQDPTRLLICKNDENAPGSMIDVARKLEQQYGIVAELAGAREMIFISTVADSLYDLNMLKDALLGKPVSMPEATVISDEAPEIPPQPELPPQPEPSPPQSESAQPQIKQPQDDMKLKAGMAAERDYYIYPPGILLVQKGEILTEEAVERIYKELSAGRKIHGLETDN